MKRVVVLTGLIAGLTVSACAKKSDEVGTQYISPLQYQSYSCRQIGEEAQRVNDQVARLTGVQDKKAENDAVATGVALVLFWPAAFFVKGNGENASELSRLKGELEALEKASIRKNCHIEFRRAPVEPAAAPAKK